MIVEPLLKLNSEESDFLSSCFGTSMENQSNEVISKMVLTYLLKRWDKSETQLPPSSIDTTPEEHIYIKVFCIIM